jgi:hypothetical protein
LIKRGEGKILPSFVIRGEKRICYPEIAYKQDMNIEVLKVAS